MVRLDVVLNSVTGARSGRTELLALGGVQPRSASETSTEQPTWAVPVSAATSHSRSNWIDVAQSSRAVPRLLDTVYRLTAEGVLPMPETSTTTDRGAICHSAMSNAEHNRKLVLDVPAERADPGGGATRPGPRPSADGSYIITGGLGGLGLFLAEKLAAAGCGRNLPFFARNRATRRLRPSN